MTRCLRLRYGAVEAPDAPPANLAYLEDRVRMFRGEPQVYGTQFIEKDGMYEPWPIEDVERVDERRASMPCLEEAMLLRLHALAVRCEDAFPAERGHDLEFAFVGDRLFLLQRRAITR